jgi:para-nitrobenzyl esterase
MRRIPPLELMELARGFTSKDEQPKKLRFAPALDDVFIKDQEKTLKEKSNLPMIIGSNKDEATFFIPMMPPITMSNYDSFIVKSFGDKAPQVLAAFPSNSDGEALKNAIYLHTCNLWEVPVYRLARALSKLGGAAYVYRFNRLSPKNVASGIGVSHGEEIPYVFGNVQGEGYAEEDRNLSEMMMNFWVQFSKTGNPNTAGLPHWPKFSARLNKYLVFDADITTQNYADEAWFNIL